jgi:hypothetical protein
MLAHWFMPRLKVASMNGGWMARSAEPVRRTALFPNPGGRSKQAKGGHLLLPCVYGGSCECPFTQPFEAMRAHC